MLTAIFLLSLAIAAVWACAAMMADPIIQGPVDAGKVLEAASITKTASFNGTGVDLGSGFAPGGGGEAFQAAIPITALDFTTGDETYSFTMQHSDDNSTFTVCGAAVSALSANVGGAVVIHGMVQKRYVRYALVEAGTTPSLTYGPVYLVPKR